MRKDPPDLRLVGTGIQAPEASDEVLRKLQAEMKNMPQMIDLLGKITWLKFQAYKKAGFTDAQALQLCCTTSH